MIVRKDKYHRIRERERDKPVVSKAISTMAVSVSAAAKWNTENMFFHPDLEWQ